MGHKNVKLFTHNPWMLVGIHKAMLVQRMVDFG